MMYGYIDTENGQKSDISHYSENGFRTFVENT